MPLFMLLAAAAGSCDPEPQTRAGVLLTERRWVAALEQRDTHALDCILDPTFVDSDWRGQSIPKAEVMARLPNRPPSTLSLSALNATLTRDVAIVRGINTQTSGTTVVGSVRFVDVFVYRAGRWQAVSAHETLFRPD
jgi:hypothetical protein